MVDPRAIALPPRRRRRVAPPPGGAVSRLEGSDRPGELRVPPVVVDLQVRLGGLRTALEEVVAKVRSRLAARLERLERAAADPGLPTSLAEDLCDQIETAEISCKKGRVKDLVRLRKLLDNLCEELERASKP